MESRTAPADRHGPPPEDGAVDRRPKSSDLPKSTKNDSLEKLQETEVMLRAAIEAMSPDGQEIQAALSRPPDEQPSAPSRILGFRLTLIVVLLVFIILVLDLILT